MYEYVTFIQLCVDYDFIDNQTAFGYNYGIRTHSIIIIWTWVDNVRYHDMT